ncbi:hypothetical protein L0Y40_02335 [Candidatus Wolfebacteria bacterium]|nr:hypothetical protein [Candidatus Wolfebacteria bacterium]
MGFAYAIGIITTDGNLSPDKRHINITSKDYEIVSTIKTLLQLSNTIGKKSRGGSGEKKYFVLQFGDINFYNFMLSIGLMPAKSKRLKSLQIPQRYFADFLRGCIDGDGNIDIFSHPESRLLQKRIRLVSASQDFLLWIRDTVHLLTNVKGGAIYKQGKRSIVTLNFGKEDSKKLVSFMYYRRGLPALERKRKMAGRILEGE